MALRKILYALPFISVILLSFFLFAPVFAKTLNTDHAVHILMSNHVFLPGDMYYWGQDRLGSFLPILTNLFLKIIPVNSITGISIVEFILLFFTFYFLQSLVKNYLSKLLLCALLFIPFPEMTPQVYVGHPYVSQFFVISLALFLCDRYLKATSGDYIKKLAIWVAICALLLISVWISDLSIVFVAVFITAIFIKELGAKLNIDSGGSALSSKIKNLTLYYLLFFVVFIRGVYGLLYFKSKCYQQPGYNELVNFKTFRRGYSDMIRFFTKSLEFKSDDVNISIYHLVITLILIVISVVVIKNIKSKQFKFNFLYSIFFVTFFLSLIATLLSNWAFLNAYGARYFIFSYLFLMFFIVFYTDALPKKTMLITQILLVIGIASYTFRTYQVQEIKCLENGTNHSLKEIQKFEEFKNAGIIADYWFSYICCIDSKMNVVATPHDHSYVRNPALIDSVCNRPKILIIKNLWLDTFPDTLNQFYRKFIRNGIPQSKQNFEFCEYSLLKK